ncbi:hypothetical protein M8J75_016017 [Diaphorina citri]|nr:hypothetical protein M8J75_016017 [Diaphorina citri]
MDVGLLAEQILQGKQMSSAVTMSMLCTTMRESDEESSSDVNAAPPYPKLGGSRHLSNDKDEDALENYTGLPGSSACGKILQGGNIR